MKVNAAQNDLSGSAEEVHTPLPWQYVETPAAAYVGAGRFTYRPHWEGTASIEELRANAEFIVRAVNTHDALVEVRNAATRLLADPFFNSSGPNHYEHLVGVLCNALALVEGGDKEPSAAR